MRFTVRGASSATGDDVVVEIEARNQADARSKVNALGVFVSDITPTRTDDALVKPISEIPFAKSGHHPAQFTKKRSKSHRPFSRVAVVVPTILILVVVSAWWFYAKSTTTPEVPSAQQYNKFDPGISTVKADANIAPTTQTDAETLYEQGMRYQALGQSASNLSEGRHLLETAADAGSTLAMHRLAYMYLFGEAGAEIDYPESIKWLRKAAIGGDSWAMYQIGGLYLSAKGVAQDDAIAMGWFCKAANAGNSDAAKAILALCSEEGALDQSNARDVAKWLQTAADAGDPEAMTQLGLMYKRGRFISQDYAQAKAWFAKAASDGQSEAMADLGSMYEGGFGMKKDMYTAMEWYCRAVDSGNRPARDWLAKQSPELLREAKAAVDGSGDSKLDVYTAIGKCQAAAGDLAQARILIEGWSSNPLDSSLPYSEIAVYLAQIKHIDDAKVVASYIPHDNNDPFCLEELIRASCAIAIAQDATGDTISAKQTLESAKAAAARIGYRETQVSAFCEIADGQIRIVDQADALATIATAKAAARRISDESLRAMAYYEVSYEQANAGDINGAITTANSIGADHYDSMCTAFTNIVNALSENARVSDILAIFRRIPDPYFQCICYCKIRHSTIDESDRIKILATSKSLAAAILDPRQKDLAYLAIVEEQAESAEISGAIETAQSIQDDSEKDGARIVIATAQIRTGDISGAKSNIEGIHLPDLPTPQLYIDFASAEARSGDISGAIIWAHRQTIPRIKAFALIGIAEALANQN